MTFLHQRRRRITGVVLVVISLAFHLATLAVYRRQPDLFAAFTVFPIWFWGLLGGGLSAFAYWAFRAPLGLLTSAIWAFTVFLFADETLPLGRLGAEAPRPGIPQRHHGRNVLRVATINWGGSPGNFSQTIIDYRPDIVCIQEIPHPYRLRELNISLYGGKGDYRYDAKNRCGVLVRGEILRQVKQSLFRGQQIAARMPDGREISVVNLHLTAAATDMRLWELDCWKNHRTNRQIRRAELATAINILNITDPGKKGTAIVAGDFNAPSNDRLYGLVDREMTDTFAAVGTGWPNTYHRRIPLLRLDHIFVSDQLMPVRSRAVTIPESDHRMVISDMIFE